MNIKRGLNKFLRCLRAIKIKKITVSGFFFSLNEEMEAAEIKASGFCEKSVKAEAHKIYKSEDKSSSVLHEPAPSN